MGYFRNSGDMQTILNDDRSRFQNNINKNNNNIRKTYADWMKNKSVSSKQILQEQLQ